MSRRDLNAIPRIIEVCEVGGDARRTASALEVLNHLMGATKSQQSDLVIPPAVLARLLRAASGERVELGRLVFVGHPSLREQASELADAARKLSDLCRAGSSLRAQVEATLTTQQERRHQVAVIAEELVSGNVDEAQYKLALLLAAWEE